MQEAYGGILSFALLVVFLILVEGILGFIVVYSRTFKMKDAVIATVENYEGLGCGLDSGTSRRYADTACINKIKHAADNIHYSPIEGLSCPGGYEPHETRYFCYRANKDRGNNKVVYSVITQMSINFPIINKIGFTIFRVGGDTKSLKVR